MCFLLQENKSISPSLVIVSQANECFLLLWYYIKWNCGTGNAPSIPDTCLHVQI